MFEPQLQHNQDEFDRLSRKKWKAFILLMVMIVPGSVLAAAFPENAWLIAVGFLLIVSAVIIFYEVKKTLVFRRDLREQRGLDDS